MKRIAAFTIMELTVAMLVSAIVIAITYTAYTIISQSYLEYHQKHQDMAVLIRLDELLQRDFERAEGIFIASGSSFLFKDSLQTVSYTFTPDYVLRSGIMVDTFKVTVSGVSTAFERQAVTEQTLTDNSESSRIDELSFQVLYQKEKFPYHYLKLYSSENLIHRKSHAIH